MVFNFNYYACQKLPKLKLCYPNKKAIGYIGKIYELKIDLTFLDISEMTFTIKSNHKLYDHFKKTMVIHVSGVGYFIIKNVQLTNDGHTEEKLISCESYETILNETSLTLENTTYQFYDSVNPTKTLLGLIALYTGWTIGHVDASLLDLHRTFDNLDNIYAYNLMMTDMSKAYGCYFLYDIENNIINAYDKTTTGEKTNIALTFNNLLEKIEVKETDDDICSVLAVAGAENVYISNVNPLGNSCLYDFSYYMNHDYGMSEELKDAIKAWDIKRTAAETNYATLVEQRQTLSDKKITATSELSVLETEYKGIQDARSALSYVDANVSDRLAQLYAQEQTVLSNISVKKTEITTLETQYNTCVNSLKDISTGLSLSNTDNFTIDQQAELKYYMKTGSYTNENFVYTSIMTESQKINLSKELKKQAEEVFEKLSQPCFEFSMEIDNYLYMQQFSKFVNQTQLGVLVNAEMSKGKWIQPRLLKIQLDYDNLKNTKFIFSDTLRLQSDIYVFEDSYNASTKASGKVAMSSSSWDEPKKDGFYDTVKGYMSQSLNLAQQDIMSSENQEILIGSYGMIGRKFVKETQTYDPHEIRLNNNVLCFSADGFQTVKTAVGFLNYNGNTLYGINGEVIIGNIFIGNQLQLYMSNKDKNTSFIVNGDGATLVNSNMTVNNDTNKIIISPDDGIKLQKKNGTVWDDKLYFDFDGDLVGNGMVLKSSNVGGWTTTDKALTSPTGDYIGSDGTGKLSLLSWTNNTAKFDGNIYANNLQYKNGEGSTNVFVNGTMGGSWLTGSSVDYDKLSDVCVRSLRAGLITADTVQATYATIGSLNAATGRIGTLEANSLTVNDLATNTMLVYGGKLYIGNTGSYSKIESILTIISQQVTAYRMYLNATGGIELNGGVGGISIYGGEIGGNPVPVTIGKTTMVADVTFNDAVYFTGGINTASNGTQYWGTTEDVEINGTTLCIKNGLIVEVKR